MIKNYMTYPLKNMRITCRYDQASHAKHSVNVTDGLVDYPIDDGGKDTGKDPIYCPCDEMKVTAIRGVGNSSVTNTIWLVSTSQVVAPTFTDIAFMTLTHPDDDDIKNIKVGDVFHRGDIICYEGSDGATSNHIHITCGRGSSITWKKNSNGAWVMAGDCKRPEHVFYVDRSFTTELWGGYLPWTNLPEEKIGSPVNRDTALDQVEVIVDNLYARREPGLNGEKLGYINRGIYNILDSKELDNYTWKKLADFWIATNEGWTNIYPKQELEITCEDKLNSTLQELDHLQKNQPKLIYTCKKTGKYLITLEDGKKLYIL